MKKSLLLKLSLGLGAMLIAPGFVLAIGQEENAPEYADVDVPAPPALPDPVESGQALEPEITIIHKDDATITEYRINNNLYKVKVVPFVGKPYYLIDRDGDGVMEGRSSIYDDIIVPQWVLFSW
jgi:hypothetical protein